MIRFARFARLSRFIRPPSPSSPASLDCRRLSLIVVPLNPFSREFACIRPFAVPFFVPLRGLSLLLSTKATKLPTKLATKLMQALKGRNIPAQGNALGNGAKKTSPVGAAYSNGRGRNHTDDRPGFQPLFSLAVGSLGFHPRLGWGAPLALIRSIAPTLRHSLAFLLLWRFPHLRGPGPAVESASRSAH